MISMQEFADSTLAPEYRQKLLGPEELMDAMGWGDADMPVCCGERVCITSFIGTPYKAECKRCGALAAAVDGPVFEGATCRFIDPEKVDTDTASRWIIVRKKVNDR